MVVVILENEQYRAELATLGAELQHLVAKKTGIEYIWQADPKHWGRHAPILFPIVGALKNNHYHYQGQTYELPRHGFARDKEFQVVSQTRSKVTFRLVDDETTRLVYPFSFQLEVCYELKDNQLIISYQVYNSGNECMLFSIGAHPAFRVPLDEGLAFSDYFLTAFPAKSRTTLPLVGNFIDYPNRTIGQTNAPIAFNQALFANDALIYETKGHNEWTIQSEKSPHKVTVSYEGFPYVGLWSTYPVASDFVCIEPWYGIADTVDASGNLADKKGICRLDPNQLFEAAYHISVS